MVLILTQPPLMQIIAVAIWQQLHQSGMELHSKFNLLQILHWLGGNDVAAEGQWVWNNGEVGQLNFGMTQILAIVGMPNII